MGGPGRGGADVGRLVRIRQHRGQPEISVGRGGQGRAQPGADHRFGLGEGAGQRGDRAAGDAGRGQGVRGGQRRHAALGDGRDQGVDRRPLGERRPRVRSRQTLRDGAARRAPGSHQSARERLGIGRGDDGLERRAEVGHLSVGGGGRLRTRERGQDRRQRVMRTVGDARQRGGGSSSDGGIGIGQTGGQRRRGGLRVDGPGQARRQHPHLGVRIGQPRFEHGLPAGIGAGAERLERRATNLHPGRLSRPHQGGNRRGIGQLGQGLQRRRGDRPAGGVVFERGGKRQGGRSVAQLPQQLAGERRARRRPAAQLGDERRYRGRAGLPQPHERLLRHRRRPEHGDQPAHRRRGGDPAQRQQGVATDLVGPARQRHQGRRRRARGQRAERVDGGDSLLQRSLARQTQEDRDGAQIMQRRQRRDGLQANLSIDVVEPFQQRRRGARIAAPPCELDGTQPHLAVVVVERRQQRLQRRTDRVRRQHLERALPDGGLAVANRLLYGGPGRR